MSTPCTNCLNRVLLERGFVLRRTHPDGVPLEHPGAQPGGYEKGERFVSFQTVEDYAYYSETERIAFMETLV